MRYDLSKDLDRANFLARANLLASRGEMVELTSKKPRSLRQNAYLHVALSYFAALYGETVDYVKVEFFKKLVNPETFWIAATNPIRGTYKRLRSTTELSTEELTLCIERFRNWAVKECGVYVPSPEDSAKVAQMEYEVEHNNKYL